jgi:hypothetical protein
MKIMSQKWRMDTLQGVVDADKISAFFILSRILWTQDFVFNSTNFFSIPELFQSMFVFVGVSSSSTKMYLRFCSKLTTFGVNIVFVSSKRRADTLLVWYSQALHVIVWFFVKRNFVCESKFSWWLSRVGVSFLFNDFAIKHIVWKLKIETVSWEKSVFFQISWFKISICIWLYFWMLHCHASHNQIKYLVCSGLNNWDNQNVLLFLNQLYLI